MKKKIDVYEYMGEILKGVNSVKNRCGILSRKRDFA